MSQNHGGWIVRFGVYEANLRTGELRKQGARIKLQEQPFQVLAMLLEKPGEIVTREEMRERLWPQDTFVDFDHSLNKAINKIREALCDSAENPRFVETLARRGYRFLAPVHYPDPEGKHSEDSGSSLAMIGTNTSVGQTGSGPKATNTTTTQEPPEIVATPAANPLPCWRRHRWTAASISFLALASVAYLFRPEMPAPRIARVDQLTNDGVEKKWLNWGGSKLFFTMQREGRNRIFQMPDKGGTPQDISHFFPGNILDFIICDISKDGNQMLLTFRENDSELELPVWTFDFRNQALQRVGNLKGALFRMSPDEKRIAFLSNVRRDLYLAEADGSQLKKIYSFKNRTTFLRWHANGKALRARSLLDSGQASAFWDIGFDGTGLHQLLPNWKFEQQWGDFTWDGKYYVFLARMVRAKKWELWAHNEKADFFHWRLKEPTQLSFGPDDFDWNAASKIAPIIYATGIRPRGEMMRIDLKSGKKIPFLGGISADCLDFTRDGEAVVYVTYPEGEMWRSRKDGSEKLKLTALPNISYMPRWSPDGTRIAFYFRPRGKPSKIALIPRDGGTPEILIPGAETDVDPNWSPDGTKIVYSLPRDITKTKEGKIWILDLNSRKITEVPGSQGLWYPRWSPDGKYLSAHNVEMRLKLYEFKTNRWTDLVHYGCGYPNWSRDGKFIQFGQINPDEGIYRAWIADGKVERIVDLKEIKMTGLLFSWLGMTPEGDPLILESRDSNEIYAYHLEY